MEHRIARLRGKYADDAEALAMLDQLAEEPAMHRRHADFYAYEFFVARRPLATREKRTRSDEACLDLYNHPGNRGRR